MKKREYNISQSMIAIAIVVMASIFMACPSVSEKPSTDGDADDDYQPGPNAVQSSWGYWEGILGQWYIGDKTVKIESRTIGYDGEPDYAATYEITAASEAAISARLDTYSGSFNPDNALSIVATARGSSAYRIEFPNDNTWDGDTIAKAVGRESTFSGRLALPDTSARPTRGLRALGLGGAGGIKMVVRNLQNDADVRTVVSDELTGEFDASATETGSAAPTIPGDEYEVTFPEEEIGSAAVVIPTAASDQDIGQIVRPTSEALTVAVSSAPANGQNSTTDFLFLDSGGTEAVMLTNTGAADTPTVLAMFMAAEPSLIFSPYTTGESGIISRFPSYTDGAGNIAYYIEDFSLAKDDRFRFLADVSISTMLDPSADYEDRKVYAAFFSGDDLVWMDTLVYRFYRESFTLEYRNNSSLGYQTGRTKGVVITPDARTVSLPDTYFTNTWEIPLPKFSQGRTLIAVVNGKYSFGVDAAIPSPATVVEGSDPYGLEPHGTRESATVLGYGDSYEGNASPSEAPDFLAIDPTTSPHPGGNELFQLYFVRVAAGTIRRGQAVDMQLVFRSTLQSGVGTGMTMEALDDGVSVYSGPYDPYFLIPDPAGSGAFTFYDNKLRITVPWNFEGEKVNLRLNWFDGVKTWSVDFQLDVAAAL